MECALCCEVRRPAQIEACGGCNIAVCRACARRHAATREECPGCRAPWDEETLRRRLGGSFVTTVQRKRRIDALLFREKAHLPATEAAAAAEARRRRSIERVRQLRARLRAEPARWDIAILLQEATLALHAPAFRRTATASALPPLPCPWTGCRGFVGEAGACGLCARAACPHCGERGGAAHRCDPDTVSSVRVIRAHCRPCPGCGAHSMRTEGCPVMWCVACHAFWHWEEGRLLTGAPHNPDHRAWAAREGQRHREYGDLPCGGVPETILLAERGASWTVFNAAGAIRVAHTRLRPLYVRTAPVDPHRGLRIGYLVGDLADEAAFGAALWRAERLILFRREVGALIEGLVFAGVDVLQRVANGDDTVQDGETSLVALRAHWNDALARLGRGWGRRVPLLADDWSWGVPGRRSRYLPRYYEDL